MNYDDGGQEWYETVAREEEYIMEQRRDFRGELHSEFMDSAQEYCAYCLQPRAEKWSCCKEAHWVQYSEMPKDDQETLIDEEVGVYEEWSRK
jgi:hypothetical protein